MKYLLFVLFLGCSQLKQLAPEAPVKKSKIFSVKWAKNLDPYYHSGNLPLTTAGAQYFQDAVFVGTLGGEFYSFDAENGRMIWKVKEKSAILHAPLVTEEYVYYGSELGRLVVRDQFTGKLKYSIDLGAPVAAQPVLSQGRLLVHLRGHQLVCLDAETGKIIWSYRRAVPVPVTFNRHAKPLVHQSKIYLGFADGYLLALSLEEGSVLWEQKIVENQKFVDIDLNPLLIKNSLLSGSPSSPLKAVDPLNGAIKTVYPFQVMANILTKGDVLVLGTSDGEVVYISVQGEILKRSKVSEKGISSLQWWAEKLVLSSFDGKLYALDPLDFKVLGEFSLGSFQSTVFGELSASDKGLAVLTSRNRLYFFE